jgi:hypothetical protein
LSSNQKCISLEKLQIHPCVSIRVAATVTNDVMNEIPQSVLVPDFTGLEESSGIPEGTSEGTNEGISDGNEEGMLDGNEEGMLDGNVDPGAGTKFTGDNVTPPLGPLTVGANVIGD